MGVLTGLTHHILALGVLGVFFGMMLESMFIPLPSEIILPYAGFLVASGRTSMISAVLAGLAGGLLGAWIGYEIAYFGGRALVERYGRYIGIRRHEMDRADRWFERHGDGAVFLGRLLPAVRTFISLPAGIARMHRGRFLLFTFLGALPWTVLFTYIGYTLGRNWSHITSQSHLFALIAVVLAAAWLVLIWRHRRGKGSGIR